MKRIIKLTESELMSLIKKIIREDDIQKNLHKGKLAYKELTDSQKNKIKGLGMKVFDDIKNFVEPETNRNINYWLEKNGLQLKVPDPEFIERNIDDINFVIDNIELSNSKKSALEKNLNFLTSQLESPNSKIIVLFHEENDEWSVVNMFDNNLILWLKLINNNLDSNSEIDVDEFLDSYFKGGTDSKAGHDLLRAILIDRESHKKTVFSKTLVVGQEIEDKFFSFLKSSGVNPDNLRVFSGGGNFVDRAGFDGAMKCNGIWFPIQVKSNRMDVFNSIPYKGISVFPQGNEFYYVHNRTSEPKSILSLIQKCN